MDSKKELEEALKLQCEAFIMTITKLMIDAVLSFLAKASEKGAQGHLMELNRGDALL